MIKKTGSFQVSTPNKRNSETNILSIETDGETASQPTDLLALSLRIINRNNGNQRCNFVETTQFPGHTNNTTGMTNEPRMKSFQVSFTKGGNQETNELRSLIYIVSQNYGGEDSVFLSSYADDILHKANIEKCLNCFRDLAAQKPANSRENTGE